MKNLSNKISDYQVVVVLFKRQKKKRLYDYKYFPPVLPSFHSDVNVRGYTHNNMLILNGGRYYYYSCLCDRACFKLHGFGWH